MTQPELQALCAEWQQALRLQDWDVEVKIERLRWFDDKNTAATVIRHGMKQTAQLHVLDERDESDEVFPAYDQEVAVVHELLHICFKELGAGRHGHAAVGVPRAGHPPD